MVDKACGHGRAPGGCGATSPGTGWSTHCCTTPGAVFPGSTGSARARHRPPASQGHLRAAGSRQIPMPRIEALPCSLLRTRSTACLSGGMRRASLARDRHDRSTRRPTGSPTARKNDRGCPRNFPHAEKTACQTHYTVLGALCPMPRLIGMRCLETGRNPPSVRVSFASIGHATIGRPCLGTHLPNRPGRARKPWLCPSGAARGGAGVQSPGARPKCSISGPILAARNGGTNRPLGRSNR